MSEERLNEIRRSASGARISGDDYQHLVTWCAALLALRPGSNAVAIELEAPHAGCFDDVVIRKINPPHEYWQVKYSVDASHPVSTRWLTKTATTGRSILRQFNQSWLALKLGSGAADLRLVTNREIDPSDEFLRLRDGRTELLTPAATQISPRSKAGRIRAEWETHLRINTDALMDLLVSLRLQTGRSFRTEKERAEALMMANGLRSDEHALAIGRDLVRNWVASGVRKLTVEQLRTEIRSLDLGVTDPWAILIVQAIAADPHPDDGTEKLDWIALFKGESANERRELHDSSTWMMTMAPQLAEAARRIQSAGHHAVFVRGALRLATWFAVGAAFRAVAGFNVSCRQMGELWSSETAASPGVELATEETVLNQGEGLAIGLGIAADPSEEVLGFLRSEKVPVRSYVHLSLAGGAHNQAIQGPGSAVAVALAIRDRARRLIARDQPPTVHLFQATPGGLSLLLGHRWNRMAPTILYEDIGPGRGYIPTFHVLA